METTTAADALRRWALDEELKSRVMADPALADCARRVADRYTAGEDVESAIRAGARAVERGHRVSIEYTGESVRDAAEATAATDVFVSVAEHIGRTGLPSTVSGDLSHIGLLVSEELVRDNASRLAQACAAVNSVFMISTEGSDRADQVLEVYDWLSQRFDNVGITLQARLHRSADDVERLLAIGGRIRLVKGAFYESDSTALSREDPALAERFERLARRIVDGSGRPGERIAGRNARSARPCRRTPVGASLVFLLQSAVAKANTSTIKVLRRPVEFTLHLRLGMVVVRPQPHRRRPDAGVPGHRRPGARAD